MYAKHGTHGIPFFEESCMMMNKLKKVVKSAVLKPQAIKPKKLTEACC